MQITIYANPTGFNPTSDDPIVIDIYGYTNLEDISEAINTDLRETGRNFDGVVIFDEDSIDGIFPHVDIGIDGTEVTGAFLSSFDTVIELADVLEQAGDNAEAFLIYINKHLGTSTRVPSLSSFEDDYQGKYRNGEEFAQQLIDDIGYIQGIPDLIANNIDWEGVWDDLRGDYSEYTAEDGSIILFQS